MNILPLPNISTFFTDRTMLSDYSDAERKILTKFFSNVDQDIFALTNLPEVIKGTLFSRYSRSSKSLRRLFLDEFYQGEVSEFINKTTGQEEVDLQKAEDFYERVLVGYGDDSVAELGGAHVAIENISNLATKFIEDARIGLSPLEKSTRYVFYDQKVDGKYQFYTPSSIAETKYAKKYEQTMSLLFSTYSKIVRELYEDLVQKPKPDEDISDTVYKASCRGKACDVARYLLPMSTLTNMGVFGNGRAYEYLLMKLRAHPLVEMQDIGVSLTTELRKVIPAFVKRIDNQRGQKYTNYLQGLDQAQKTGALRQQLNQAMNGKLEEEVKLIHADHNALDKLVTACLLPYSDSAWNVLYDQISGLSEQEKHDYLQRLTAPRQVRHHKPPRAFEYVNYTFEIISDIGAYRDLQRHRMATQQRQPFTTDLGYTVPPELESYPELLADYHHAMQSAAHLFQRIRRTMPLESQYCVPFGYRIRYQFHMNLREVVHLTELRSISQGHPAYRKVAQKIAQAVSKQHPIIGQYALGFVDYASYELERLEAFKKLEQAGASAKQAFRLDED